MSVRKKRKNKVRDPKQVAVSIIEEGRFQREKILGLIEYYSRHSHWTMYRNEFSRPFVNLPSLKDWRGDGVVGTIYTQEERDMVDALSMPFVNTSSGNYADGIPSVHVDNEMIGEMAAKHLMQCEVDCFLFVGPTDVAYMNQRYVGLKRALELERHECSFVRYRPKGEILGKHVSTEVVRPSDLLELLKDLAAPTGIMAGSDLIGFAVLEACRRLGLRSPEDVAVIGVNNDEMYCNLAHSSLTSIDVQAREVGFQAAKMLDGLMSGETIKETLVLIPPERVIYRDSTDRSRSKHSEVARALRFIRNHPSEFIDVSDVLDTVPVSRRWLEMRFKAEVGHGIYQEIRRVHVERAKELLTTTQLSITLLSRECGFNSPERFDFAFRKLVGMSASEFREANQQTNR